MTTQPSNKKRRLDSGGCERISQPDLDAQQLFAEMRDRSQQETLSAADWRAYEDRFQQILHRHKSHIAELEKEVSTLRSTIAKRTATTATEAKESERTAAEFATEKRIAAMTKVQFSNPKGKMFVEFFPSYMTIRPQSRHDSADPAVVCFDDIDIMVSVPTKHKTSSITVMFTKRKVPLRYQKANRSASAFGIIFESNSDPEDYQVEVAVKNLNGKADLPALMKGSREGIFNEIVSRLSNVQIQRHDKTVFRSAMGKGQFYVTSAIGASTGNLYPLRCGLVFTKPLMFIPTSNMESFHSGRESNGSGLRFFDFEVVRKQVKGKEKKKEAFSMISVQESPGIMAYFNTINVPNTAVVEARKKAAENEAKEAVDDDGKEKDSSNEDKVNGHADGGEEEDDERDSDMDSDDSMFDLDEELDNYYQQKEDGDSEDSGNESSGDDMEEMRKIARKEKTKQQSEKKASSEADVVVVDLIDHDVVRARNDGVNSSSSTESDASMNEPLWPTSCDDKNESDIEMIEPTTTDAEQVAAAKAVEGGGRPRRWRRRPRRPPSSSSAANGEDKSSSGAITNFFAVSK